jgi:predicted RNase H-like HicB family nuclease
MEAGRFEWPARPRQLRIFVYRQRRGGTLPDVPDLDLTIVYEADPESDWIVASIPEVQGVHSQGRNRAEAREMVLSALGDWLRFYFEEHASPPEDVPAEAERESIHLTIAA